MCMYPIHFEIILSDCTIKHKRRVHVLLPSGMREIFETQPAARPLSCARSAYDLACARAPCCTRFFLCSFARA